MSLVRRAVPEDAAEVLRLRQAMIDSLAATAGSTDWHAESLPALRGRPAEPEEAFAAFVVDHPKVPEGRRRSQWGRRSTASGGPAMRAG